MAVCSGIVAFDLTLVLVSERYGRDAKRGLGAP